MMIVRPRALWLTLGFAAAACGTSDATTPNLEIVPASGGSLAMVTGDAFALKVVEKLSDGTEQELPSGALVTWTAPTTVDALDTDSTADSPMPTFATAPTAIFVDNPLRPERAANLNSVVFIADAGTANGGTTTVSAAITGALTETVSATITVTPTPVGDAARGATLYGMGCKGCHGATGGGSPANADGTYTLFGVKYAYPAPGINGADSNLASDPDWSAALLAMAARADIDNSAVVLRKPMPDWLTTPLAGHVPTTQDFADIYAYLQTQTQ